VWASLQRSSTHPYSLHQINTITCRRHFQKIGVKYLSSVTSIPMEVANRKRSFSEMNLPDEPTQLALGHFKDLHPIVDDPEASFQTFVDDAGCMYYHDIWHLPSQARYLGEI
jgi:hypothetical protein